MAFPGFENVIVCKDCGGRVVDDGKGNYSHKAKGRDHILRYIETSHDQKNRINKARGWLQDADGDYSIPKESSKAPMTRGLTQKQAVAARDKKAAAAKKPKKKAAPYVKRAPKLTERTGVLRFPDAPAVVRKKDVKDGSAVAGEILQAAQEASQEKLAPGWKSYIRPDGTQTQNWEESVEAQRMPKSDRDVRAKGAKHLEKDHPWVTTNSFDPDDQNEQEGPVFSKIKPAPTRAGTGKQTVLWGALKQMATNIAHYHKKTFDPSDEYEYQVYQERPQSNKLVLTSKELKHNTSWGVRRRLRYCEKCAPVEATISMDRAGKFPANKHWYGPKQTIMASITGRYGKNPKQQFVRPEPTELDPESPMHYNGRGEPQVAQGLASTPVIQGLRDMTDAAIQTKWSSFQKGASLSKPTPAETVRGE
jgi:hypothetical protein